MALMPPPPNSSLPASGVLVGCSSLTSSRGPHERHGLSGLDAELVAVAHAVLGPGRVRELLHVELKQQQARPATCLSCGSMAAMGLPAGWLLASYLDVSDHVVELLAGRRQRVQLRLPARTKTGRQAGRQQAMSPGPARLHGLSVWLSCRASPPLPTS